MSDDERPEGKWTYCGGPSSFHLRRLREHRLETHRNSIRSANRRAKITPVVVAVISLIVAIFVTIIMFEVTR